MSVQRINPESLLKFDQLAQAVVTQAPKMAFIAGQSAMNKNFELVGGDDCFTQSVQALRNLRTAVEAAGSSVDRVVSSTVYLKSLTPAVGEQFIRALGVVVDGVSFPPHAFSMVGVQSLASPDILVEISAIAVIDA
ncbi:RidA family protein [Aromatoleum toluclasticum]|uniref:RidA family protein n=1 Tax=Aromatoleum toluclasticum TaxID=92003 RepID=UPI000368C07C|nr:RidA family protein [Aromatoleum toluclasticum]